MVDARYRCYTAAATKSAWVAGLFRLGCICLALILLSACEPKKLLTIGVKPEAVHPFARLAPPPQSAAEIQALMRRARLDGDVEVALLELERITEESPPPLNEEASFRRVELLFQFRYPDIDVIANDLIARYPRHALVPYTYMWLARWWEEQGNDEQVLHHLGLILRHERLTRELAEQSLGMGVAAAHRSAEWDATRWLLDAARTDVYRRGRWLRSAANRASMQTIVRLRQSGMLQDDLAEAFYLHAARSRLMTGDMDAVQRIADFLAEDAPFTPTRRRVQAWASGLTEESTIGVLLPLSGDYARYGKEALRGLRLALSLMEHGENVSLRIEDTASSPQACISAYRRMKNDVSVIIGPLLNENTEALLPYMKPQLPVISLSNRPDIAEVNKALFVHSLSAHAQAQFMAAYIWQQGAQRIVVVTQPDSESEAAAFAKTFESLSGEVVDTLVLPETGKDFRQILRDMRARTDDEELLAELDAELTLLSAEDNMEIRMPVGFDGMYLALPGKRVALLAGQLAYVGIRDVPLYGSSRWRDGHLLVDKGRYLSTSRFADTLFPEGDTKVLRHVRFAYREGWGSQEPSKLTALAYDTMLIATVLSSRLGLHGKEIIHGLHDSEGFPGLTGHVRFDGAGVGHKMLDVFTIQRRRIIPAG